MVSASPARGKALVLGSETGGFLGVIRSLGRRGIEVHIAWCPQDAPASRSRYVRAAHRLPRPGEGDGWVQAFADLMARERFDLVIATDDPTLIPLQRQRAALEPHGRLYLLDERSFQVTFDKIRTREFAQACDVPVAAGETVSEEAEIEAVLARRSLPLIVRPQASFQSGDLERRNSVKRAYSAEEAHAAIAERLALGPVLVEENVTGTGWGVEVLATEGEIVAIQQHERLHEPLQGGGSSYRRTVALHPAFGQAVARMLRELRYTGVAMFEFKGDPDGRWILVEINGRFWGSLPLSLAAGIDFPYGLWQLLVEGSVTVPSRYRLGVYARNAKRDLKWLWLNLRADRHDPTLATQPLHRVAGELGHVLRGREHLDQFTLDDLRPGMWEFAQLGSALAGVVRMRAYERPAVRRRLAARAAAALAAADSVLFVCHGNICRSPFAAVLARELLPASVTVISAGTSPDAGRRSPTIARRVAAEFGVDLEDHRSLALSDELVEQAAMIIVFDERNLHDMRRRFPRAGDRVHLIGALGEGSLAVDDPLLGDESVFRDAYDQIARALRSAARSLTRNSS